MIVENYFEFIEFDGLVLYCEKITFVWSNRDLDTCNIRNLTVFGENLTVIGVLQDDDHFSNESTTFHGLLIENQEMNSMPLDLGLFFGEIKFLRIWNSQLEFISKKDLQHFNELEGIDLVANKLTFLASDLFVFNHKLRHVDMSHNPLQFVGEHFLDRLRNATTIDFMSCNCIHYVFNSKDCCDMRPLRSKLVACNDRRLMFRDTKKEMIIVENNLTNWSVGGGGEASMTCSRTKLQRFLIISFAILTNLTFICCWR